MYTKHKYAPKRCIYTSRFDKNAIKRHKDLPLFFFMSILSADLTEEEKEKQIGLCQCNPTIDEEDFLLSCKFNCEASNSKQKFCDCFGTFDEPPFGTCINSNDINGIALQEHLNVNPNRILLDCINHNDTKYDFIQCYAVDITPEGNLSFLCDALKKISDDDEHYDSETPYSDYEASAFGGSPFNQSECGGLSYYDEKTGPSRLKNTNTIFEILLPKELVLSTSALQSFSNSINDVQSTTPSQTLHTKKSVHITDDHDKKDVREAISRSNNPIQLFNQSHAMVDFEKNASRKVNYTLNGSNNNTYNISSAIYGHAQVFLVGGFIGFIMIIIAILMCYKKMQKIRKGRTQAPTVGQIVTR